MEFVGVFVASGSYCILVIALYALMAVTNISYRSQGLTSQMSLHRCSDGASK
jgi:hypothetical protein